MWHCRHTVLHHKGRKFYFPALCAMMPECVWRFVPMRKKLLSSLETEKGALCLYVAFSFRVWESKVPTFSLGWRKILYIVWQLQISYFTASTTFYTSIYILGCPLFTKLIIFPSVPSKFLVYCLNKNIRLF